MSGDFVEYEILDQLRHCGAHLRDRGGGLQNSCRHRGVKVVEGRGTLKSGFTCPFHGWCYGLDGKNTFVSKAKSFSEHNLAPGDIDLVPVRCEVWGGCAWINLDTDAPALRELHRALRQHPRRLEGRGHAGRVVGGLPPPGQLEAGPGGLPGAVPRDRDPPRAGHPQATSPAKDPAAFDPEAFIDAELHYLHVMSEGMGGMVHANDVAVAERQRTSPCPRTRRRPWRPGTRSLNDAVVAWHTGQRVRSCPDLNDLEARGIGETMYYCFPHYFVLPMYSSATLVSLPAARARRDPDGDLVAHPVPRGPRARAAGPARVPKSFDDETIPPIPTQDFSNLPRQQRGLHNKGFEYMRLSEGMEGGIANFERTLDGFLAGRPYEQLDPALRAVNVNPLEQPVVDLGF